MGESKTNAIATRAAYIRVTTKPGATVTFVKGGTTFSTKTADSSGIAQLEVRLVDWGTFTINGSWSASGIATAATGSASVTISASTTYNVTVALKWYLIQNGNFCNGFTTTKKSDYGTRTAFEDNGDYVWLTTDIYDNPENNIVSGYFTNGIEMDYWNTLYIDSKEKGTSYVGVTTDTTAASASFTNSLQLCSHIKSFDTRSTKSLSLSGVTGTKYVALRTNGWVSWSSSGPDGTGGFIDIWNLYLQG